MCVCVEIHTCLCPWSLLADWVCSVWRRPLCVPHQPLPHVWVHGELHPPLEAPPREVHDEQCVGELHHPAGVCACVCVCVCMHGTKVKSASYSEPSVYVALCHLQIMVWYAELSTSMQSLCVPPSPPLVLEGGDQQGDTRDPPSVSLRVWSFSKWNWIETPCLQTGEESYNCIIWSNSVYFTPLLSPFARSMNRQCNTKYSCAAVPCGKFYLQGLLYPMLDSYFMYAHSQSGPVLAYSVQYPKCSIDWFWLCAVNDMHSLCVVLAPGLYSIVLITCTYTYHEVFLYTAIAFKLYSNNTTHVYMTALIMYDLLIN